MTPLTPQQIAIAAAKRRATQAANRAAGIPTVRQQRAAAKAAKAGQAYVPPPPSSSRRPSFGGRRRRYSSSTFAPQTPQAPVFSTPKPSYRALKLVALAHLEDAVKNRFAEQGLTDEARAAWANYKKVKTLALAPPSTGVSAAVAAAAQTEADSALRLATIQLVKLAY